MKMKKIFTVGIVFLLMGLSVFPSTASQFIKAPKIMSIKKISCSRNNFVEIAVREYNGKGRYIEVKKRMPLDDAELLKKKIDTADNLNRKLGLLKEYGLISNNASAREYQNIIRHIAKQIGFTKEKMGGLLEKIQYLKQNYTHNFVFNVICRIDMVGTWLYGFPITIFFPPRLFLFSFLLGDTPLPAVKSLITVVGTGGLTTQGLFGNQSGWAFFDYVAFLFGFTGFAIFYIVDYATFVWEIEGFSLAALGFSILPE